eukprot:TRINITY_DN13368_c0_g1_i1.p1 TRINITY_DN13368_c0_g1~~TRINITY_DN13368_c0_g1_i1.p1  ORF type:complete len:477 (-),score=55.69 TRINITY_DN13368_c0_g1_i1:248-1678(-)
MRPHIDSSGLRDKECRRPCHVGDDSEDAETASTPTTISSLPSPSVTEWDRDTLLVFDWDDTILPTSWLQRFHLLSAGMPMAPEVQRQVARLASACATTLSLAASLGTLVFVTNSAPGWLVESCELFMPQILAQVHGIKTYAKPMTAPISFKITTFEQECSHVRNLISVGDGNTERAATLNLMPGVDTSSTSKDLDVEAKSLKSVKLVEMPTCQELIAQHEVLQARLADIVSFHGCLDLKARFSNESAFRQVVRTGGCSLVHFSGPLAGTSPIFGRSVAGSVPAAPHVAPSAGHSIVNAGNSVGTARIGFPPASLPQTRPASAVIGLAQETGCHLPRLASIRGRTVSARRPKPTNGPGNRHSDRIADLSGDRGPVASGGGVPSVSVGSSAHPVEGQLEVSMGSGSSASSHDAEGSIVASKAGFSSSVAGDICTFKVSSPPGCPTGRPQIGVFGRKRAPFSTTGAIVPGSLLNGRGGH